MFAALIGPILQGIFGIVDQVVEDKDQAAKLKAAIVARQQELESQELKGRIDIILAEARGSWMQKNWRPVLMMVVIAIVANNYLLVPYMMWIGADFPALELPDALWNLLTIGVGGYVVGRSAEKTMEVYKKPQ